MSVTQKMFVCSAIMLIAISIFAQAIPVPVPDEVHPEYRQFVSTRVIESAGEPVSVDIVEVDPSSANRPVRSASPFFGIIGGYEKTYKNHHHHHEEHYEPEYHRPQYHKPQYHRPQYHKPQYQQQHHGSGAGSFASAGSFSGNHGGSGHSQSSANSQSASFGFGPFQASYSASSAHSGSHSGGGGLYDY